MKNLNVKYSILFVLFLIAFGERVLFDLGPNIELVTMALILAAFYFDRKTSFWLTFLIMFFSDLVIGNTNILLFTWTGFLIPALFVVNFYSNKSPLIKTLRGTLAGITSTGFFFIWTNFGVWLLSGMYPKTATGLLMSYINALPFLRYQLTSTVIFIPMGFVLTELAIWANKRLRYENKLNNVFSYKLKVNS